MKKAFSIALPSSLKIVLLTLAWHENSETGQCNPSTALLEQETGLNRKTLFSAFAKLKERGLLEIEKIPGKKSTYRVVLEDMGMYTSTENGSTENGTSTEIGSGAENGTSTENGTTTSTENGTRVVPKTVPRNINRNININIRKDSMTSVANAPSPDACGAGTSTETQNDIPFTEPTPHFDAQTASVHTPDSPLTPEVVNEPEGEPEPETPAPAGKRKPRQKKPVDPAYLEFARVYQEAMLKRFGATAPTITDALIEGGADAIDKCVRLDKIAFDELQAALRWAYYDEFWADKVKSLAHIRAKSRNGSSKVQNLLTSYRKGTNAGYAAEKQAKQNRDALYDEFCRMRAAEEAEAAGR